MNSAGSITIHTDTAEATRRIGETIGQEAAPGDIYLLTGPLGAGKTCLTQGIARGLGVPGHARSPTFVLVTRYRGRLTVHHADLYRIDHPAEAWDLGLEDIMSAGEEVLVVEWADRAADIFPEHALWIDLDYDPEALRPGAIGPGATRPDGAPAAGRVMPDEDGSVPSRHRIAINDAPERYGPLLAKLSASPAGEPG